MNAIYPDCCYSAWRYGAIEYSKADANNGPKETGWCLDIGGGYYTNINYCPFCGAKLPEKPE